MVNHFWDGNEPAHTACREIAGDMVQFVSIEGSWESVSCPECLGAAADAYDPTETPGRSTIADEAQSAVYGDRGKDYGHPRENFTDTAALWSALLADRLSAPITPEDVARCMIAVKLARDLHSPKRDNRVDIVGYAITLDRLETGL